MSIGKKLAMNAIYVKNGNAPDVKNNYARSCGSVEGEKDDEQHLGRMTTMNRTRMGRLKRIAE